MKTITIKPIRLLEGYRLFSSDKYVNGGVSKRKPIELTESLISSVELGSKCYSTYSKGSPKTSFFSKEITYDIEETCHHIKVKVYTMNNGDKFYELLEENVE